MLFWWLLSMVAQAASLQSSPLETKAEADKLLSISKRLLRREKGEQR